MRGYITPQQNYGVMMESSLKTRAREIFIQEGFISLIKSTILYLRTVLYSRYIRAVEFMLLGSPTERQYIDLNGVTVPVDKRILSRHVPFYQHPLPTKDDPTYEHIEAEAIKTYSHRGDNVVIIGGGLGVTAVIASRETSGIINVFEQSEETYEILRGTVDHNDHPGEIKIHHTAVGKIGGSNFSRQPPTDIERTAPSNLPDADLYEMDCEGAETTILEQMEIRPQRLLIETHSNHEEVTDLLQNMGYQILEIVSDGKGQHQDCTHIRAEYTK